MNEQFEKQIRETIPKIKDKLHILHFSTGADSVACYLRLKEWEIKPILIYDYFLPHIPMVDNYIDYIDNLIGKALDGDIAICKLIRDLLNNR